MSRKKEVTGKFPQILFITREDDTDGSHYFTADESFEGTDVDGKTVAVYERKDVKVLRIVKTLADTI